MNKLIIFFSIFLAFNVSIAQTRASRYELEVGVISTQNMEIHGFDQGNATSGWRKSASEIRLEYWSVKENDWNYGLVFQPLSLNYASNLTSNLNYKGRVYDYGDAATLQYQFPTVRFTGNYPYLYSNDGKDYVRFGGSAIVRYASVALGTASKSFTDTNLLLIPVFNIESNATICNGYSFFTRSDFLPSIDGNTLLDGLFDIFVGVKKQLPNSSSVDFGIRSFFGGYDPKKADDYANRIFLNAVLIRYSW